MGKSINRYWLSWYQPSGDVRPLTFPPNDAILGWWSTGISYVGYIESETLCALVQADSENDAWTAVRVDWPELIDYRFSELKDADYTVSSDRFPLADWMKARLGPVHA